MENNTKILEIPPPIIEEFILEKVNGYKNIRVQFNHGAKVISAENGSGKTTFLNALHALLCGKLHILQKITFEKFTIRLAGGKLISANKSDLSLFTKESMDNILKTDTAEYLMRYGASKSEIEDLLINIALGHNIEDSSAFERIYFGSPLDKEEIMSHLQQLLSEDNIKNGKFFEIKEQIKDSLGDAGVIYLPTYRRIEVELPEFQKRRSSRSKATRGKFEWDEDQLIFFGLQDVENRLETITDDIRRGTFEAYARISGKTLDQLVVGTHNSALENDSLNYSTIKVMLARLGKSSSETEDKILDLIKSEQIKNHDHDYLRYFLFQLVEIYQEKQAQENAIEEFVSVVSSYWKEQSSENYFSYDKLSVEAKIINKITNKKLPLSALSSGEKQIMSIFARLYLTLNKKFIVLIDEPEISLSMEWQRKFLPDVVAARSCAQLIAITHSPFVFDNQLDPYAGSMEITYPNKS